MDRERENKTLTLSELLNKSAFKEKLSKSAFSNIAKHSTIFSFWENTVGKKIANLSKPYKISGSKIYVTTKSPVVSQQILLMKNKLLEKINVYSKPLGIKISEIIVNYKNFEEITEEKEIPKDEEVVWIEEKELDKIELMEDDEKSIKSAIDKITFMNKAQKEALVTKIIYNYKAIKYRKNIKNE